MRQISALLGQHLHKRALKAEADAVQWRGMYKDMLDVCDDLTFELQSAQKETRQLIIDIAAAVRATDAYWKERRDAGIH